VKTEEIIKKINNNNNILKKKNCRKESKESVKVYIEKRNS